MQKILFLMILLFGIACAHPNKKKLIGKRWGVVGINKTPINSPVSLHFRGGKQVSLHLSANTCSGRADIYNDKNIDIQAGTCSTMCCDDSLSLVIKEIVFGKSQYSVTDSFLTLKNGQGSLSFSTKPPTD